MNESKHDDLSLPTLITAAQGGGVPPKPCAKAEGPADNYLTGITT
jgi:hypothetical protein